jgi:hypothetical protein
MSRSLSIHFALPDLSLCHGTDGTVVDFKIGISKKLFSQSHKTPYSRTKDICLWSHRQTVVALVSSRERSTTRFSFYALHSPPGILGRLFSKPEFRWKLYITLVELTQPK